jgi:hypothetical protein
MLCALSLSPLTITTEQTQPKQQQPGASFYKMAVDTCLARKFLDSKRPSDSDEQEEQQEGGNNDDADDAAMRGQGQQQRRGRGGERGDGRRRLTPFRPQHLTDLIQVGRWVLCCSVEVIGPSKPINPVTQSHIAHQPIDQLTNHTNDDTTHESTPTYH